MADAGALAERLERRRPWSRDEVTVLLQGAINAARTSHRADGIDNLATARAALRKAEAVYYQDVQTKNRISYVIGLFVGVCVVVLVPILLLWATEAVASVLSESAVTPIAAHIKKTLAWVMSKTPLDNVAPLFFFAGLGACASVLSRLTTIDLKDETSKGMVVVSAAARPALAVIFASVIFVILNNGIIKVGEDDAKVALILIAAFLCGYSERFATDILDRVPFGATNQAPVPSAGANTANPGPSSTNSSNGGNG